MPYYAVFCLDLHCLLRQKRFSEKEIQVYLDIITCDPQYIQWTACADPESCVRGGPNIFFIIIIFFLFVDLLMRG